jgi:hypothetical protein
MKRFVCLELSVMKVSMYLSYFMILCCQNVGLWGVLKMPYNGRRLGEGCLTEISKFAECLWQLLPNRCYVLGGLSALILI